jgi:peptide/nickel transport system substrate-binding protein
MVNKKLAMLIILVMVAPLIVTACGPTPEPVVVVETVPVEVTRIIQEEGQERTVVETVIVEVAKEVTPVPPTPVPPTPVPELQESDTVVIAMQQEPDTLHTAISSMSASNYVMAAVIVGCMGQNDKAEWINLGCDGDIPTLENGAAQFVGEGEDQHMEITHKIKQGWRWTDGTPVTPRDVIYTWQLQMDPDFQLPSREQIEKVYDIEMVDDNTYIVKMMSQAQVRAAAAGTLEGNVDFAAFVDDYAALGYTDWQGPVVDPIYWTVGSLSWLPAHVLQDIPAADQAASEFARKPIGDSPYVVKEWTAGQEIILEKTDLPWPMPDPKIKTIIFRFFGETSAIINALKNHEVDAAASSVGGLTVANAPDLDPIDAEGVYKVNYAPGYAWEHIDLNMDKFPLDDVRVRQALYYAIDKQALVDTLYFGKQSPTDLPIPKGLSWAYTDNYNHYPYDPDKARELLTEAGWDCSAYPCTNADGQKLEFTLMTTDRADRQALAQVIQQMWKALNIGVNLQFLYGRGLFQSCDAGGPLYCRTFDAAIYTYSTGDDPGFMGLYNCAAIPSEENNWSGQNDPGFCTAAADEALSKAEKDFQISLSRDLRYPYYETFFQEWTREVPVIPLFSNTRVWVNRAGFQNYKPGPTEFAPDTWNFWEWELYK